MVNRAELLGTLAEKVSHVMEIVIVVMITMVDNDSMMVHMVNSWHGRWFASRYIGADNTASSSCITSFLGAFRRVVNSCSCCTCHIFVDEVNLGEVNQRIQDIIMSIRNTCGWWQYDRFRMVHGQLS